MDEDKTRQTIKLTKKQIGSLFPKRIKTSHKGTNGHVLIVGGTKGLVGAPIMAAAGAVRSGAGKTSLAVPSSVYSIASIKSLPEIMVHEGIPTIQSLDVMAIGPGLGRTEESKLFMKQALEMYDCPVVLDADALFWDQETESLWQNRKEPTIMTPHVGEFIRMSGYSEQEIEEHRIDCARRFSMEKRVILILKGAPTYIAFPTGEVYENTTGNPGMGTGGMGDVLTGIIAALWGQSKDARVAALTGVYLHGLAADILAKHSPIGYTPTEVGRNIGQAIKEVVGEPWIWGEQQKR